MRIPKGIVWIIVVHQKTLNSRLLALTMAIIGALRHERQS